MARRLLGAVLVVVCGAMLAGATGNVSVITRQVTFEDIHEMTVNSSVEYILQFTPESEQTPPARVWVQADGGDTARPLLVTARQRTGARTWQLPYKSGSALLYEMERTLCPTDSLSVAEGDDDCQPAGEAEVRGSFSLHLGTSCSGDVQVQVRAHADAEWRMPFDGAVDVLTQQGRPRVHFYEFAEEQDSVRLVVESQDDLCATIAVQNYTCPIAETLDEIKMFALRMTVLRSGGAHLSRSQYPRGFYVVAVVHDTDTACRQDDEVSSDWLWDDVFALARAHLPHLTPPRAKRLTLRITAALSRGQYAVGVVVTLAVFLLFYVAFGLLVWAQRIPAWRRLVGPRAVLAPKPEENGDGEPERAISATPGRRRRDSTATFDSSDNSDSESDEEPRTPVTDITSATLTTNTPASASGTTSPAHAPTNGVYLVERDVQQTQNTNPEEAGSPEQVPPAEGAAPSRPFGLPARLHVAALARRRGRVINARSDRYLYTLYTVALFYALPVVQFVAAFQFILNAWGSLDMCYYNFLCAHPVGALSDFNHVFSNAGYLLLGALFMLQVRRRRRARRRHPRHEEYGIPAHYGLLSSLGAALMMVALLSATYHVCPNGLNFQFDTAFMYVMAVLSMVKIYQSRHPDVNARAHATFGVLAVLIALVVWGVLAGGPLFWSLFTVVHVFAVLLLSLNIYYVGQFRFEKESLATAARGLTSRPLYTPRLVLLVIANACNWAFALYGLFTQSADFASHLLNVLLFNTLLYMVFYICMKLLVGERLRWYAWAWLGAAAGLWAPAMYFFLWGSTDWAATPAQSRQRNHECRVLRFYDAHDLWHMLSAAALFASFNVLLTWDDGLAAVPRTDIAVF